MEWELNQVCIVVRDMEKTVEFCRSALGFGPFRLIETPPLEITYKGKKHHGTIKAALIRLGGIHLEFIEATPGENMYWDFLQEHGEGLHHVLLPAVEDLDKELAELARKGAEVTMTGTGQGIRFAYVRVPQMGNALVELVQRA